MFRASSICVSMYGYGTAESIGLDTDTILAAARSDSNNTSDDMTLRANVPSFSAEDNANARVWFDNLQGLDEVDR